MTVANTSPNDTVASDEPRSSRAATADGADTGFGADGHKVLPHRRSSHVVGFFGWYTRRLFRKRFAAVRVEKASLDRLNALAADDRPLIIIGNHPSWWDPLVAVLLNTTRLRGRPMMAVMDRAELERFAVFRKLGVLGVDPDDPDALDPMVRYLADEFRRQPNSVLWITPQGHFTDVRVPARLRPGAARLAARLDGVRVAVLAMEFTFWDDQFPEVFMRVIDAAPSENADQPPSTTVWLRTMTAAMRDNQAALAELVKLRRSEPFVTIAGKGGGAINPVYDLVLKLRGRTGELGQRRRDAAANRDAARSD